MNKDTFIVIKNEEIITVYIVPDGENIFYKTAKLICMSDYTGDEVLLIVFNGYKYEYKGWQPGLIYTFYCVYSGDSVVIQLDADRYDH